MRLTVILLLAMACANPGNGPGGAAPAPETETRATTATSAGPRVTFPDGHVVRVEVANDNELRAQGLMFRDHLAPDAGMLFFFTEEGEYPFWMKNTRIPLDMIWIDSNRRVAAVKYEVPPCKADPCPSYPPNANARYVLEVAGGVARQHGVKAGDVLRFEETDAYEVR